VSSKLLEDRQAEMRERMLQETANRKRHQFALEPKDISFGWDTGPDEPQFESEPLEKTRVESAIERHPNGSTTVSRDDLYMLVWTEAMTTVAARFGVSANCLARVPPLNVHDAQKLDHYSGDSRCPERETVVFIGSVAFGLTIFETTEEADVKYDSNSPIRYVRVGALPTKRRRSRK